MEIEKAVETAVERGPCADFAEVGSRYLEEYLAKIQKGVERLDEDQTWWRPARGSNSVGNLLLHLNGNLSLWVLKSLGKRPYERDRAGEFSADRTHRRDEMLAMLAETVAECRAVLSEIDEGSLDRRLDVQGYSTDVLGVLFHAVEHMSYHTGQILWIVKHLTLSDAPFELYPQHSGE